MVIPLLISSINISVSFPVRDFIKEVFPWSMCPDKPMTVCRTIKPYLTDSQGFLSLLEELLLNQCSIYFFFEIFLLIS